jgi:hypothetical protein
VKNIRQEYEQLNQQQRNELQSWYRTKVTEAVGGTFPLKAEWFFNFCLIRFKKFNLDELLKNRKISVNRKKLKHYEHWCQIQNRRLRQCGEE